MLIKNSTEYKKISNGISVARIISMLWIFSVNYFGTSYIFEAFYRVSYSDAIKTSKDFIDIMNTSPYFIDKFYYVFSYAGWSGVLVFTFLSGFSLWFSILVSGKFKVGDYIIKRFNNIYVPYFFAVIVSFLVGVFVTGIKPKDYDLAILIMGSARFVDSAYAYNPPLWFITAILVCYLFFPIIPIIYNRFHFSGILMLYLVSHFFFFLVTFLWYPRIKSPLYPLMPFWIFICNGVLISHIIYRSSEKNLGKYLKIISILTTIVGVYCLYRFIYLEPASNLQNPWYIKTSFVYATGIVGALTFLSIGYLLPVKFHNFLRWLSRGTFTVFLYHYLLRPVFAQMIKFEFLPESLSIAFITFYSVMLIVFSLFQEFFDKTVIRYTKKMTSYDYTIK